MQRKHMRPLTAGKKQAGVSLIVVMLLLIIASVLGVGGAQIASMAERSARNERDMQLAWQSAEAALMDAEFDIHGPGTSTRKALFAGMQSTSDFVADCGGTGNKLGLCEMVETGKPAWLTANFEEDGSSANTVPFGQFTGRTFAASTGGNPNGVQPEMVPRYIIEPISDPLNRDKSVTAPPAYIFRVTAMGFGPRKDIQAVSQILYRN
jgi:type IV pilus assembly protein PilX